MRKTAIAGAGMIRFGRFPDRFIEDMGAEGARVALAHNGGGMGPGIEPAMMSITILTQ